ncbi:hypothetical protein L249_5519 [Ophiocordyceps polyrhachis-furcata BCC 54312]|uniref:Uncharacterized protein n=1 Tax=Ophiocordyceps polyrhachis-furcata BCC 54312 TaxID=1330021 RepID=A0A367LGC3_9HYPO|nr:hypothetical protein L249_5519 [Ophiocordyceps polyrhachis-furcata BCC 54312]
MQPGRNRPRPPYSLPPLLYYPWDYLSSNYYIAYSYFPARYKESNVTAGKSLEVLQTPRGYRPISLLNIVGKLTALIRSYLTSCSSRLKVDSRLSKPFDIERGSELLYFIRACIANISTFTLDGSIIVPTQEACILSV